MEFSDKTAIITGAASGMGALCARKLAAEGAKVVLTDIDGAGVKKNVDAINAEANGKAVGVTVDVTNFAQVEHAATVAKDTFGRIDILLSCAGGNPCRILNDRSDFQNHKPQTIDFGLDVNLKGAMYFARAVVGTMIAQKSGVMLFLGSVDGVTGGVGAIEYAAAKSGLIGMTKSLALYGAPHNVRACCVSPGPVLTRAAMANMKTPLGRAAEPDEVVDLMLYLCSTKGAFITGSNYLIDGGRACGAGTL